MVEIQHNSDNRSIPIIIVGAILLVAGGLRLWGIRWGGGFVYHPDEIAFIRVLLEGIKYDFYWSHPLFYPTILSSLFRIFIGDYIHILQLRGLAPLLHIGRLFSVVVSLGTIVCVFLISKKLFNQRVAYLAAFILAITPVHVWNSHYMYNDIPLTFFIILTIYLSLFILESAKLKWYLLAAVSAAFAMGMKHTGAFAVFPIVLAHLLKYAGARDKLVALWNNKAAIIKIFTKKELLISGAAFTLIYTITNPNIFLKFSYFYSFITQYSKTMASSHAASLPWHFTGYAYRLIKALPFSFGVLLYILVLCGVIYSIKKRKLSDIFLTPIILTYFILVGWWPVVYFRYLLPIVPLLIILAARFSVDMLHRQGYAKKLFAIFFCFVIIYTIMFTISTTARFSNDTRDRASRWIYQNIPQNAKISIDPKFYSPKIAPSYNNVGWTQFNKTWLLTTQPTYIILSSERYSWCYRGATSDECGIIKQFRDEQLGYIKIKTFKSNYFNQAFYSWLDPIFEGFYVSPTIEVYKINR